MKIQSHLTFADYISRGSATTDRLLAEQSPLVQHVTAYYNFFAEQLWADEQHQPKIPALLGINAFTLWTGAARMALSGHEAAIYPMLRTALESACYALVITRNPDLGPIWSARHDGDEQRKACRKAFTPAVRDAAQIVDAFELGLGTFVLDLYNANIDFGAHPNALSLMNHVRQGTSDEGSPDFSVGSIYPGNSFETFRGLVAVTESGRGISMALICALPTLTVSVVQAIRELDREHEVLFPRELESQPKSA